MISKIYNESQNNYKLWGFDKNVLLMQLHINGEQDKTPLLQKIPLRQKKKKKHRLDQ